MSIKGFVEKIILILIVIFVFVLYFNELYLLKLLGYLTLLINIYSLIKYRKNPAVFLVNICLFVFDYSFIISKYISYTSDMSGVFKQFIYDDKTMFVGILCVFIFHVSILMFCKSTKLDKNINFHCVSKNENRSEIISIVITLITAFIITDYYWLNIIIKSRTIYEYTIILFVLACYYSKKNISKYFILIVMFASFFGNSIEGGRVLTLQPLIAFLLFYYNNKLNYKVITIGVIIGILVYTILGVYGDIHVTTNNYESFKISNVINNFFKKKFVIDTSVSAYGTSLSFIALQDNLGIPYRINNLIAFLTKYLIFGSSSKYQVISNVTRNYYVHYFGAYLPLCFNFWLGYFGVFLSGFIIAKFLNISLNIHDHASGLKKVIFVYFVSTLPRWYLYYPTPLFRGALILIILYFITYQIVEKGKK